MSDNGKIPEDCILNAFGVPVPKKMFVKVSDIPEANWLVEGIAMETGIGFLIGNPEAGKTTFVLQIIDAMIRKADSLCGLRIKSVPTLLIEQDEGPRLFRNHIDRVLPELPCLADMDLPSEYVTWTGKGFKNLKELIGAYQAKLVFIDSFTSLGIDDINHPSVGKVSDEARVIANETGCAIMFIHHLNKEGDQMGSMLNKAKADFMAKLDNSGLWLDKARGSITCLREKEKVLPITRTNGSILFRLSMTARARTLVHLNHSEGIDVLMEEYPTNRNSARVTLSKTRKEMGIIEDEIAIPVN